MLVAASTDCYHELPLTEALGRLVDLEYTSTEIVIDEDGVQLKPSEVMNELEHSINRCRDTQRMDVVAFDARLKVASELYYQQFSAICRLAKAIKVVTITVPSGELGTPFNEEVERLRKLVALAAMDGARVSIKTQIGCLSEDPDTVVVLCDNVKGLGVTLDPSHFVCGPHRHKNSDKLMKYVFHTHLRDSTKDKLQVRVGQGEIEYSRLVALLRKANYKRALSVDIRDMPDVDHMVELRKMRLLLESLL